MTTIESPNQFFKRVQYCEKRLQRAYAKHRKEVMLVDPALAAAMIQRGTVVAASIADYDPAIDRRFDIKRDFDPKFHTPVRLAKTVIGVLQ